jgi:phosphoenolpyruvate synthase/pyruvate phosphate dikinase
MRIVTTVLAGLLLAIGSFTVPLHGQGGRIEAWAPVPVKPNPFTPPHKALTKLSDVLAKHKGQQSWTELELIKGRIAATAQAVEEEQETSVAYSVGTMVELPRACLMAGEIGQAADFFSFGTNDLTQTTFGLSRDDAGRFLGEYADKGIIQHDPFVTLDKAVEELIEIGVQRGRAAKPNLKIGICGEHGGDPETIQFCERIGLTYVSCSPYRVPIARLASAQASLAAGRE